MVAITCFAYALKAVGRPNHQPLFLPHSIVVLTHCFRNHDLHNTIHDSIENISVHVSRTHDFHSQISKIIYLNEEKRRSPREIENLIFSWKKKIENK